MRAAIQPSMPRLPMFPPPPPAPPSSTGQKGKVVRQNVQTSMQESFTHSSNNHVGQIRTGMTLGSVGQNDSDAVLKKPKAHLAYTEAPQKVSKVAAHNQAKHAMQSFMKSTRAQHMTPARKRQLETLFNQLLRSLRG